MSVIAPNFNDYLQVLAPQVLARGSVLRSAALDLRQGQTNACYYADILVQIARGGTTALSSGVNVLVRPLANNNLIRHPSGIMAVVSSTAAAAGTTVAGTNVAAGDVEVHLASIAGLAVGDIICLWDSGNTTFTRFEFGRIAKLSVASGTGVTLDAPTLYAHTTAQADTFRNGSDVFAVARVPGGRLYEVIVDYAPQTTGDSIGVAAYAQLFTGSTNT